MDDPFDILYLRSVSDHPRRQGQVVAYTVTGLTTTTTIYFDSRYGFVVKKPYGSSGEGIAYERWWQIEVRLFLVITQGADESFV